MELLRTGENQHLGQFDISVHPDFRRQGLARRLLGEVVETARRESRRLLLAFTMDRVPAGEIFMQRLGAQRGLEAHTNQLRIAELDHRLVQSWLAQAAHLSDEFVIGLWDGPYPEEQIEAVAVLWDLTNQQPRGDLEMEDAHFSPEQLRQMEQQMQARGTHR